MFMTGTTALPYRYSQWRKLLSFVSETEENCVGKISSGMFKNPIFDLKSFICSDYFNLYQRIPSTSQYSVHADRITCLFSIAQSLFLFIHYVESLCPCLTFGVSELAGVIFSATY